MKREDKASNKVKPTTITIWEAEDPLKPRPLTKLHYLSCRSPRRPFQAAGHRLSEARIEVQGVEPVLPAITPTAGTPADQVAPLLRAPNAEERRPARSVPKVLRFGPMS